MNVMEDCAPGAPGIEARWTSSAKSGLGTALSTKSPVWFTMSHGILNEIYYPRVDSACTRDFGLIIAGTDLLVEEKRHCRSEIHFDKHGIPAFQVINEAKSGNFRIEKQIVSDPDRPCVLQRITFIPHAGKISDYRIFALLAPHLVNAGMHNSAWIGKHRRLPILFAKGRSRYLALASSLPWGECTVGYVGTSDGWQQLHNHGHLQNEYQRADNGNVSLTGEIGFDDSRNQVVLALGFGSTETEAAANAHASLQAGFDKSWDTYRNNWQKWQDRLIDLSQQSSADLYRISATVLAAHRAVDRRGAVVASLSIPWGFSKGDDNLGGYHLVWPRDLVETAGGFLAAGDWREALSILQYLREVQQPSGRWPQNMWLDGEPYWHGIQMDEVAFPILLVDLLRRNGYLRGKYLATFAPMVQKAISYLLMNGPVTCEDRWEEDAGYSPFTLAVEIAALLAAADLLQLFGDPTSADYLRETADCWNEQVEKWTFAGEASLCRQLGISGYYVRIASPNPTDSATADNGDIQIKNRRLDHSMLPSNTIVSPDALALVRFGLRSADDPRILDTIKAIDHTLRAELPQGPLWYRYTGDGYGEHRSGAPFDGMGIGRPWPLLAGERAHYELAAGNRKTAEALLATLEDSAGASGLLPEQTWDGPDLPERELLIGKPSGSAMPLVWAHSEHIKLLRSLADGKVFDMPPQGRQRYVRDGSPSLLRIWRFNNKLARIPAGKRLRIEVRDHAVVHWSRDDWQNVMIDSAKPTAFGIFFADLPVEDLTSGNSVIFTFFWSESGNWENQNFRVIIE